MRKNAKIILFIEIFCLLFTYATIKKQEQSVVDTVRI
jgi:hypothetical protein